MKVYAAIQEEKTGRVFVILTDGSSYEWFRAAPEQIVHGPFDSLGDIFESMANVEGRSVDHWTDIFAFFYPNMPVSAVQASRLTV